VEPTVFGAVREILAAHGPQPIRASAVAVALRDRGFPKMHPQNARAVLGAQIQELSKRTWIGTPEVLSALRRLDAELLGTESEGHSPSVAAQPAPDADRSSETLRASGEVESADSGDALDSQVPAGLPIALRVILRDGPAALETIHRGLLKKGWPALGPSAITAALSSQPCLFVADDGLWRLAPDSSAVAIVTRVAASPVETTTTLLEPVGDEWQLKGLPAEPEMRHVFLEIYRNSKARTADERAPRAMDAVSRGAWGEQRDTLGVWIAGCGELYHLARNCSRLRGGQAAAIARGQSLSWVRQVTEHEALEMQRDCCSLCGTGTGTPGRR
jgi:hypothetical protein